jgi:hypothetical protein
MFNFPSHPITTLAQGSFATHISWKFWFNSQSFFFFFVVLAMVLTLGLEMEDQDQD